jgi:hypothetical protein
MAGISATACARQKNVSVDSAIRRSVRGKVGFSRTRTSARAAPRNAG